MSYSDKYLLRCKRKGLSPRTIRQYDRVIAGFLSYLAERKSALADTSAAIAEDYIQTLSERCQATTVRHHANVVSTFLSWCVRRGIARANPFADDVGVPRVPRTMPRAADPEKAKAVIDNERIPLRTRLTGALGYYGGLRCSEIARLPAAAVDTARAVITVCGKGGKERTVPMGKVLLALAKKYLAGHQGDYLFGRPYCDGANESTVRRWISAAFGVNPHALRHAAGAEAARRGVPMAVLAEFLGHKSLDQTLQYARMSVADTKAVAEVL